MINVSHFEKDKQNTSAFFAWNFFTSSTSINRDQKTFPNSTCAAFDSKLQEFSWNTATSIQLGCDYITFSQ